MLSEELRRRIEALNRQEIPALPAVPPSAATRVAGAIAALIDGVHRAADAVSSFSARPKFYQDGPAEHLTEHGPHGRYRYDLQTFWPEASAHVCDWQPNSELTGPRRRRAEIESFRSNFPGDALFLDLETCGFAGSMVFLIGLVWCDDGQLVIDQLLARNYAEEKAALHTLQEIAEQRNVLVTFNGKSFDWPMVQDRWIRHRLVTPEKRRSNIEPVGMPLLEARASFEAGPHPGPLPGGEGVEREATARLNDAAGALRIHYDVLHHARRRWKRVLPNCKLQTLEQVVCRRHRREDISGSEIPLAYHDYVRTGDDRQMKLILHHNAMDLVTLVQIALRLAE
jgi:uncharacterized protein YprB with RNaseH-like and TPR domain